jgi:hypothetical protein
MASFSSSSVTPNDLSRCFKSSMVSSCQASNKRSNHATILSRNKLRSAADLKLFRSYTRRKTSLIIASFSCLSFALGTEFAPYSFISRLPNKAQRICDTAILFRGCCVLKSDRHNRSSFGGDYYARNNTQTRAGNGRSGFGLDGPCAAAGDCPPLHGCNSEDSSLPRSLGEIGKVS